MKDKLVSKEQLQEMFPSLSDFQAAAIMRLFSFGKANQIYDRSKQHEGVEFARSLLADIGVGVETENIEVLERFSDPSTNFVTVSNHPYGHIDALSLISVVGALRPDYKVTANFILMLIDTLAMHFIAVNPYSKKGRIKQEALEAVQACLKHMQDGHPLGFFPAGTISYLKWRGLRPYVEDVEWMEVTVRMVQRSNLPVIPVHISGRNSRLFYSLGMISWKARYLRVVSELRNKRGKTVRLTFGEPVMPEELKDMKPAEIGRLLFGKVYELRKKKK